MPHPSHYMLPHQKDSMLGTKLIVFHTRKVCFAPERHYLMPQIAQRWNRKLFKSAYQSNVKNYVEKVLFRLLFLLLICGAWQPPNLHSRVFPLNTWSSYHFCIFINPGTRRNARGALYPGGAFYTILPYLSPENQECDFLTVLDDCDIFPFSFYPPHSTCDVCIPFQEDKGEMSERVNVTGHA